MICVGGIKESEDEHKLSTNNPSSSSSSVSKTAPNSSIKKSKKKVNKPIRIENDQVAKRLEFDLLKSQSNKINKSSSSSPRDTDESDNVFFKQESMDQMNRKPVSLDINSSQTPIGDSPGNSENMFLNDLNFGFDNHSYEDYKF